MTTLDSRIFWASGLFLLTLFTGLWLKRAGRPHSILLSTGHKLIALADVVLTILAARALLLSAAATPAVWTLLALAGLSVVGLFASGALLSGKKPAPSFVRIVHKVAPALVGVTVAAALYQLARAG